MSRNVAIKKTSRETICRKCRKHIYKNETYWKYSTGHSYCKKCATKIIKRWVIDWSQVLNKLDCDPTKCSTCNRRIVCIT